MAQKLILNGGPLPFIWNVSGRVGPNQGEPNRPTDVELVSALCGLFQTHPQVVRFGINGTRVPLSRGAVFDTTLAFWIFRMQQIDAGAVIDGVVSPAHGTAYARGQHWTIVTFNRLAREANQAGWETLDRNTFLSQALRAELSAR